MRVTIHIGTYKTATSSIQFSLSRSTEALNRHGVRYAHTGLNRDFSKHLKLFDRIICADYNKHRHKTVAAMDMIGDLVKELNECGCDHMVISEEELSLPTDVIATYLSPLRDHADVRVVMVVRSQANFLESLYLQFMREPIRHLTATFDEFLRDPLTLRRGDFVGVLVPWQKTFGHDSVQVIDFDELKLSGDVVREFLNRVGLPTDLIVPGIPINPSISPHGAELLRQIAMNVPRFPRGCLGQAFARQFNDGSVSLLTAERMSHITDHYRDSNRRLRKTNGVELKQGGPGLRHVVDDAELAVGALTLASKVIGFGCGPGAVEKEKWRNLLLTKANRR